MTISEANALGHDWHPSAIPVAQMSDADLKRRAELIRTGGLKCRVMNEDGSWRDVPPEDSMFAQNIFYTERLREL